MLELAVAALPLGITDFSGLKLWILGVGGNLLIAFLVIRLLVHLFKSEWGMCVTYFAAGVLVGFFVWFNDESIAFMKTLAQMIFGG